MKDVREAIQALAAETERWRIEHRRANRHIEAAACAIRSEAFRDVVRAIDKLEEKR